MSPQQGFPHLLGGQSRSGLPGIERAGQSGETIQDRFDGEGLSPAVGHALHFLPGDRHPGEIDGIRILPQGIAFDIAQLPQFIDEPGVTGNLRRDRPFS